MKKKWDMSLSMEHEVPFHQQRDPRCGREECIESGALGEKCL